MSDINNSKKENDDNQVKIKQSVIDKLVEFFNNFGNEERIKLRLLKKINKDLMKLKYKFYNYRKDELLPLFSRYIYEFYKTCRYFSRFLDVKNHPNTIKEYLFEIFTSKSQSNFKEKLEKNHIETMVKESKNLQSTFEEIKSNLSGFVNSFDYNSVKNINVTYNLISDLSCVTNFNWYSLIHKIDSSIIDGKFDSIPNFDPVDSKYIIDELITINDCFFSLNINDNWKDVFEYIKKISNDPGLIDTLNKLLQTIKILKNDDYLGKIIRLVLKDPYFTAKKFNSDLKIVQDYVLSYQENVKKIVRECIEKINKEKTDEILLDVFKTTIIVRLKNYSVRINEFLLTKGVGGGIKYVESINYIKAFLLDICKGEIKAIIDHLLIKGNWENSSDSSTYSNLLLIFGDLSNKVIEFDNKFSENEVYGREIKKVATLIKHEPRSRGIMTKILLKLNSEALQIIKESIDLFNQSAVNINRLIQDYKLESPKMIINFKKIKWISSSEPLDQLDEIYKKLSKIVILLSGSIKEKKIDPVVNQSNKG